MENRQQSRPEDAALDRELAYHEELYGGFAQRHFARPAVRALRAHMTRRILRITGAGREARLLSLGCGIGDTELLLAREVGGITGIDLSPAAIRQANEDAARAGLRNACFREATAESFHPEQPFDAVIAIFFLHHLQDPELLSLAGLVKQWLRPGGIFYSLDPSRYRLSGAVGELLFPKLMRKYQTPDERQLAPRATAKIFEDAGLACCVDYYDFVSSPLAGLLPGWRAGYRVARIVDELLVRTPGLRLAGSNFELIASAPTAGEISPRRSKSSL